MAIIHAIERSYSAKRAAVINNAALIRKKIIKMRSYGVHDPILGIIPDRRETPSMATIVVEVQLRKLNRSLRHVFEWRPSSKPGK